MTRISVKKVQVGQILGDSHKGRLKIPSADSFTYNTLLRAVERDEEAFGREVEAKRKKERKENPFSASTEPDNRVIIR